MADLDATAMSAALKEYYDESKLTDLVAKESPFLGMIPKGKFLGRGHPYPMITDPGQASLSASFSVANTNRVGATYQRFFMEDVRRLYAIGGVDRDVIDLASSARGAFSDVQGEVDAKLAFVARELAHTAFRTENSVCGVIATGGISEGGGQTTITVTDFADLVNLGPGARLVASATAAGALRGSGTVYPVVSVDHSAGTIVLTGTAASTSSWAAGDFLHRAGNAPDAGDAVVPSGVADWIPDTAPSSTAFRGVDRSVLPDKLAGIRVDATSGQVREKASELGARIKSNSGMTPDALFVNPLRFHILEQELDSLATHEKVPARNTTAQIGYNGLRVAVGSGSVVILADPFCPYKRGYMLTMSTWKFHELGGKRQPRLRDMGGGQFLQQQDADAVKFQAEAKGDLGCSNPGANGVLLF